MVGDGSFGFNAMELDTGFASSAPSIVNVMLDPAAPWYAGRYLG